MGLTTRRNGRHAAVAVVAPEAPAAAVSELVARLQALGLEASVYPVGPGVVVIADADPTELSRAIGEHHAVERVFMPDTRYRLARREVAPGGTRVRLGDMEIGGDAFLVVAGPCAVESREQLLRTARAVAAAGAGALRGGAFKPRTSPYRFQGLGLEGVEYLVEAREATGLPFVTEVMDPAYIEPMLPLVDAFQVGARNMQNFDLLRALGQVEKPVLLKRGPAATVEEWLLAAEYILMGGNDQVMLCERGIRTFNADTRYTLDLASVALVKRETHLPVLVDPSHATGDPALVGPMGLAALAAGADGLVIEVHPDPAHALSDGEQSLTPDAFAHFMERLRVFLPAAGRTLVGPRAPAGHPA